MGVVVGGELSRGRSCGCAACGRMVAAEVKRQKYETNASKMVGNRYGRLIVTGWKRGTGNVLVEVKCDCGVEKWCQAVHVWHGSTVSCGCYRSEITFPNERRVYHGMKQRCYNQNLPHYENYGARGITICDRWLGDEGFDNFIKDMGPRPDDDLEIDRVNNELGYSPENCRWTDRTTNSRNTRRNLYVTFNGVTQCATTFDDEYGLPRGTVGRRIHLGWTPERAITTPLRRSVGGKYVYEKVAA